MMSRTQVRSIAEFAKEVGVRPQVISATMQHDPDAPKPAVVKGSKPRFGNSSWSFSASKAPLYDYAEMKKWWASKQA